MIDKIYEIQMSKAIDLAQMKSILMELLMLLVYILVGYQINTTAYLQSLFWGEYSGCILKPGFLSTISFTNCILLEHTGL